MTHIKQAIELKKVDSKKRKKENKKVLKYVCINMVHNCQQEQESTM
jgi:hypothetical protein